MGHHHHHQVLGVVLTSWWAEACDSGHQSFLLIAGPRGKRGHQLSWRFRGSKHAHKGNQGSDGLSLVVSGKAVAEGVPGPTGCWCEVQVQWPGWTPVLPSLLEQTRMGPGGAVL